MKRVAFLLLFCFAGLTTAWPAPVCESWGDKDKSLTHPGTVKVIPGRVPRLVFDLSAIPRGAKVYRARLVCSGRQPREPIRIHPTGKLAENGDPVPAGGSLKLQKPDFRSFDVSGTVRQWVNDPSSNLGFAAASSPGSLQQSTLIIHYEGTATGVPPQVEG